MDPSLAAAVLVELRAFVRSAGNRRTLPPTCHVGHPDGQHSGFAHDEVEDFIRRNSRTAAKSAATPQPTGT